MRILLDTNIIIHREANKVVNDSVGMLFRWIDNLHYDKYIHPVTVTELNKYNSPGLLKTMNIKLDSYNTLKTEAPPNKAVSEVSKRIDRNANDINDTKLLNELYCDRVDILITEDKKIHNKAGILGIVNKVFTIDAFIEKATRDNPTLVDYKVLAVKKELFGNIDINDEFFDSFREDYPGFDKWFNRKSEETAYICKQDERIMAFLYVKVEDEKENYQDINPIFPCKRRLKIGTFKVTLNGFKLGERFIKIVFDNALRFGIDEIYVTIFNKRIEQQSLINLLEEYGFRYYGTKSSKSGNELVYTRDFSKSVDRNNPKITYPYMDANSNIFIVPIYPEYHTNLFPDSILRTESPNDFIENEPHRNAIKKVYISRSIERNLRTGDIIIFYRTGGYYQSVVTTIAIVENIITDIPDSGRFVELCGKRSVFTEQELLEQWNYKPRYKPFIVNFLYAYSFSKRITLKRLIELGVIPDIKSAPRGFMQITNKNFNDIIREVGLNESIIINKA